MAQQSRFIDYAVILLFATAIVALGVKELNHRYAARGVEGAKAIFDDFLGKSGVEVLANSAKGNPKAVEEYKLETEERHKSPPPEEAGEKNALRKMIDDVFN